MRSLDASDLVYLAVMYAMLAAGAAAWVFLLEATVSRDRVAL